MPNGEMYTKKITWEEFKDWQDFPIGDNNPPLTVEVTFIYEGKIYYIDSGYDKQYVYKNYFYNEKDEELYSHENFLTLLTTPLELFHGKSFEQMLTVFFSLSTSRKRVNRSLERMFRRKS